MFALLIDPEKCSDEWLCQILSTVNSQTPSASLVPLKQGDNILATKISHEKQGDNILATKISYEKQEDNINLNEKQITQLFIFVGGSQLKESIYNTVKKIKQLTQVPVVMFPGDASQFAENVDALLFLSLASGRNAKYLIEQHIEAAQAIKSSGVETIPTGYILVDGGKHTAVEQISGTSPYPTSNPQLIADTALACQLLGHKMVYLEAGSGANHPVPQNIIAETRKAIDIPLIVGGGIKTPQQMMDAFSSGADLVVIGNHLESHPEDLEQMIKLVLF